jgi:hypothetical protein
MSEQTKVYVATAYRWGNHNGHWYAVAAGVDQAVVCEQAENESSERGGKYGVEVVEYPSETAVAYYPSLYGEDRPEMNWRIMASENIGLTVLGAAEDGQAMVPSVTDSRRLVSVSVKLPEWLKEHVGHESEMAKVMSGYKVAAPDARREEG